MCFGIVDKKEINKDKITKRYQDPVSWPGSLEIYSTLI